MLFSKHFLPSAKLFLLLVVGKTELWASAVNILTTS